MLLKCVANYMPSLLLFSVFHSCRYPTVCFMYTFAKKQFCPLFPRTFRNKYGSTCTTERVCDLDLYTRSFFGEPLPENYSDCFPSICNRITSQSSLRTEDTAIVKTHWWKPKKLHFSGSQRKRINLMGAFSKSRWH